MEPQFFPEYARGPTLASVGASLRAVWESAYREREAPDSRSLSPVSEVPDWWEAGNLSPWPQPIMPRVAAHSLTLSLRGEVTEHGRHTPPPPVSATHGITKGAPILPLVRTVDCRHCGTAVAVETCGTGAREFALTVAHAEGRPRETQHPR